MLFLPHPTTIPSFPTTNTITTTTIILILIIILITTTLTHQAAHEVLHAHSGAKLYARLTSADFADNALALDHLAARVWPELAENEPAAVLTNVDVLLRALTAKACVPNCNPSVLMKVCVMCAECCVLSAECCVGGSIRFPPKVKGFIKGYACTETSLTPTTSCCFHRLMTLYPLLLLRPSDLI